MSTEVDARDIARSALSSVVVFARSLLGMDLWDHQREVVESPARYRIITAGRQSSKSTTLAVLALWQGFRYPGSTTLIVSAGEVAARRLLEMIAQLALGSPLLRGAVAEDGASVITLANGSVIRSVPASAKQIRGWTVDLLILDEAAFIAPELWQAAEPSIIARPGSRVVMASSPWGGPQHFFRTLWRRGMDNPDAEVEAWHWPSSISPLVDEKLLEQIRERESPAYFAREYLAEWAEGAGSYFSEDDIYDSIADYELIRPETAEGQMVVGGLDYGFSNDANALVLVAVLRDGLLNFAHHPTEPVFFIPWLEQHFGMKYHDFIRRVVDVVDEERGGFYARHLASETNAVGQMPTQTLRSAIRDRRGCRTWVAPIHTTAQRKEAGFAQIRGLLQAGRFVLPRHPDLLQQLSCLEYEISDSGSMKISVPERAGHDDLCMALLQANSCVRPVCDWRQDWPDWGKPSPGNGDLVETPMGTRMPVSPHTEPFVRAFRSAVGNDAQDMSDEWKR